MKLNDIVRKIARHGWKKYLLFCLSITFAVAMVGAFGILLFSNTITNVLSVVGSTYMVAVTLYGITVIGLVIFAVYANNIYVKYKMDEIGVFLSLGLKPSDVRKLMNKEFCSLYGLSAVLGLLLALPISFLSWTFLTLFLSTTETAFIISWEGYGIALVYAVIAAGVLLFKNSRMINNIDIIQILKATAANEVVKGASFLPGLLGLICVPFGIAVFWLLSSIGNLSNTFSSYSGFGLVLSAIGLYFFIAYITSIGDFFRKFRKPYYLKNLLFFNLVKQKGKQYTLSLFISTLLITIAIFGICFNSVAFIAGYYQIRNDTFDYTLLVPGAQSSTLNEELIHDLAVENDMELALIHELQLLYIGRQHMYGTGLAEWAEAYCISVADFNAAAGTDLMVNTGSFIFFSDMDESPSFHTLSQRDNNFYLPTGKEIMQMDLQETISSDAVINSSCAITDLVVINDNDFSAINDKLEIEYQYTYYLWNANRTGNATGFFDDILAAVVTVNSGQYIVNHNTLPVRELMLQDGKDVPQESIYLPYNNNELDAARNWEFYPFSRAASAATLLETCAVYLLLMFFIAIIGFVSATMIIGLRVVNTIWQDEAAYRKAEILGTKPSGLKRLITQQMALIFFFPALIGSLLSILVINRMVDVSSASQHNRLITLIAIVLSLTAIIVEVCVFFSLRRKVFKEVVKVKTRS